MRTAPLRARYPRLDLHLERSAAWNETGELTFHTDTGKRKWRHSAAEEKDFSGGSLFASPYAQGRGVTVPTTDFGEWLRARVRDADLVRVKMDIEGAEYPVVRSLLQNGGQTAALVDEWVVEWHDGDTNPWVSPDHAASLQTAFEQYVRERVAKYTRWH